MDAPLKVLVLGAGGIVGQEMIFCKPDGIEAIYTTRQGLPPIYTAWDMQDGVVPFLELHNPEVIVNLAGENRVDVVEKNPRAYEKINVELPIMLSKWCRSSNCRLIHVSTQGVFSGDNPPYGTKSLVDPITEYGKQKRKAEIEIFENLTGDVVRLTFVIGTRPFQGLGRQNPLELMLTQNEQVQVNDRFFSPLWSRDAASQLWKLVETIGPTTPEGRVFHFGQPYRTSRYDLACHAAWDTLRQVKVHPVSHNYFKGIAPRPLNTTWDDSAFYKTKMENAIQESFLELRAKEKRVLDERAREIALFLEIPFDDVIARLNKGFGENHAAVAKDFGTVDPNDPDQLLQWYKQTESYIWELTVYHLDEGFNYSGMCAGLVERLTNEKRQNILVLGDGIGDLTMSLVKAGLDPTYNDLEDGRTGEFAQFRFKLSLPDPVPTQMTVDWEPDLGSQKYDAILALDFFEHLVNVEAWAAAVGDALKPEGVFFAQNAFGIGDAEHGNSIPMHLTINNKYEKQWVPMMESLGFKHIDDCWWQV